MVWGGYEAFKALWGFIIELYGFAACSWDGLGLEAQIGSGYVDLSKVRLHLELLFYNS